MYGLKKGVVTGYHIFKKTRRGVVISKKRFTFKSNSNLVILFYLSKIKGYKVISYKLYKGETEKEFG